MMLDVQPARKLIRIPDVCESIGQKIRSEICSNGLMHFVRIRNGGNILSRMDRVYFLFGLLIKSLVYREEASRNNSRWLAIAQGVCSKIRVDGEHRARIEDGRRAPISRGGPRQECESSLLWRIHGGGDVARREARQ